MFKEKLAILPHQPGCYLMKDENNKVIYVGKAKDLKNRVSSYFSGSHNAKTTALVAEICDFEYVITRSELESFILEINLIKEYDPRYNIKLTDDKTYPYIVLTNDKNPRLIVSRNTTKRLGKRFGPYPNSGSARETVRLLNKVFPLRKCINLPKKECLYYHIKQCLAPCINDVSEETYSYYINEITRFLKGNSHDFLDNLKVKMNYHSEKLEFEQAKDCLDLINHINNIVEKQTIVLNDFIDRDIFGFYANDDDICIQVFYMRAGAIVARDTVVLNIVGECIDVFQEYVVKFYQSHEVPKEILFPIETNLDKVLNVTILYPQKGEKKKLVHMACDNAKIDLENRSELFRNKEEIRLKALNGLQNMLGISCETIEMFDNSNTLGEYPVSAMVVYKCGKAVRNDYRKYRIKTVVGPNDYETMKEIIFRRYSRLLEENAPLPDLVIMDGGQTQVNAALEVLKTLNASVKVIGLKKNDKHKTESIICDNEEILLDKHSETYRLLLEMQEEVHRFAISFHRNQKTKGMFNSKLDEIAGVGEKRKRILLQNFKTTEAMKNAKISEFEKLGISKDLAKKIINHLNHN